ncbi:MAG: hypothetical protein WCQ99_16400 [Pseudomonadota bacterium]
MYKLLIVFCLLAGAALLEAPDDYTWTEIGQNEPVQLSDTMYDGAASPGTLPASSISICPERKPGGEKI